MSRIFKSDMTGNITGIIFFIGGIMWEIFAIIEYLVKDLFSVLQMHIGIIGLLLPLGAIYLGWMLFRHPGRQEQKNEE